MKKRILFLFLGFYFLSVCLAQNAQFCFKDSVRLTLDLSVVDSVTYLKPEAEVHLPVSCTLEAGTSAKLTYMVSDGLQTEPIAWGSTDSRIAYFSNDYLVARKAGKCIIHATYKGVTSNCVVTITPSAKNDCSTLISYAPLVCYATAEIGVYMSQALTTGDKSQTGIYPYSSGWDFLSFSNPYWHWYSNEMAPTAAQLTWEAEIKGYKNIELITRTIMLMSTMLATDIYGDMPRRELGFVVNPKYETQQEIYDWMFTEVDELLGCYKDSEYVNCSTNLPIDYTADPIFGGDLKKWEAFCKGLKARLWLRKLPNWDNTVYSCNKIIQYVDEVINDIYWEEPRYYYFGGITESNCPWGPYAPSIGGLSSNRLNESIPTTFFLHGIMGGIDGRYIVNRGYALDPRAAKIMEPRNNSNSMLHLESNIGLGIDNIVSDYPDLLTSNTCTNPYTSNTGYIPLMTTEELLFIKAEAQYWLGDISAAYNTTVEATKMNMERYGLNNGSILNGDNGDNLKNQYNRFFEIKLPKAANFTIADLMQQKYVAMYLQPEQWTDIRRYNYSSSSNGIAYVLSGKSPVYVYDVKNVHNGKVSMFKDDAGNFCLDYSLHRPYNLYESHWCTPNDFGVNAQLSPNAWVMRLTPTPTPFNQKELERMGYYTQGDDGKVLDYHLLKKHMIWAQKNPDVVSCADEAIEWK